MLHRKQRIVLFIALILIYCVSWIWQNHCLKQASQFPTNLLFHPVTVLGQVDNVTAVDTTATRFIFQLKPSNKKIRLSWYYTAKPIQAGQVWQFSVKLKPWHANHNPGLFDSDHAAYINGLAAQGYVYQGETAQLIQETSTHFLVKLRNLLYQKIVKYLSASPTAIAIVSALVLGDKQMMTPALRQMLQATGTAHLLAISGLHIGMIAAFAYAVCLRLWQRCAYLCQWLAAKKASGIIAIFTAFGYTALTGFGLPAIRSFIMVAGAAFAITWGKKISGYQTFWLAVWLGLIIQPTAIFNISFWLSYLAVFLIFYASACRYAKHKMKDYVRIQISITLGLTPLLFYYFQQTSLVGEVANFIAIPLVTFIILPLSFVACFMPISCFSHGLFYLDQQLIHVLTLYLNFLANLPFALWYKGIPNLFLLLLAMLGIFLILLPNFLRLRYLGIFFLLPIFFYKPVHVKLNDYLITVLDVGQGLSVLVQTTHHSLMYDLGPLYPGGASATQNIVVPYLRRQAINRIDELVISHQDSDHKGDIAYFLKQFKVKKITSSAVKALANYSVIPCQRGQHWQWDGVQFAILNPAMRPERGDNAQSCVLKIISNKSSILLPGDIDQATEKNLVLQYGKGLETDVLILAHHGSNTSSSDVFLQQVAPVYGIISAGFLNRYHFPSDAVLRRLQQHHIVDLNTSDSGAITIPKNG